MIGIYQCQVPGYSTCAQSRDSSTIIYQLELYMAPNYMQEKLEQRESAHFQAVFS